MNLTTVVAQGLQSTGPASVGSPLGSLGGMLLPIAVIVLIFYFLLFRPQKKQEKAHQEMLKGLKKGDKVVTIGGIHGIVQNVRETDVTLKVDEKGEVRMRFSRSAISRVLDKDEEDSESKGIES
jgi:preprotein translocase subunit YajC